jgi:drug/metabolite transporter (DMT)-like permease
VEADLDFRLASRPGGARGRLAALLALALLCFAANSLLARAALRSGWIDPASFTALRLGSGALALALLVRARSGSVRSDTRRWGAALALFAYAFGFSWAYLRIDAGVGALLLFGAVQATLFAAGALTGRRPGRADWLGLGLAGAGLVLLAAPGGHAPDLAAALAMAAAGVAWGLYTLRGAGAEAPLAANAVAFAGALPFALLALATTAGLGGALEARPAGVLLALVSGGVTSGLGYALWYAALPALSPARAGLVQLAVPVLAALGGVALLGERPGWRLPLAAALVLGGIALALLSRARPAGGPSP